MKLLGILVALVAGLSVVVGVMTHQVTVDLLAGFSFIAAITTYRSSGISKFLKILIYFFSAETALLSFAVYVSAFGLWPASLEGIRVPSTVVMTVALFSIICHLTSFIPVARKTLVITDRYFLACDRVKVPLKFGRFLETSESTLATAAVVFIVFLNQIEVYFTIILSFTSRSISDAMQNYNSSAFWRALLIEFPIYLTPYLLALLVEYLATNALFMRWRQWLTHDYMQRWLDNHNHYGMMLAGVGTDNPDQRIQEDIPRFIDGGQFGGLGVFNFSINLISQLSSLVSFSLILWALSANLTIPGTHVQIPGLLLWCALIYAFFGTSVTALIGRPLAALAFARQHYEANFRFGLARLREYSEQIALLAGERTESSILAERFKSVLRNFYSVMFVKAWLLAFIQFFNQFSNFIPYIILGTFYFARTATLGVLTQARIAFGTVNESLTFFVTYYSSLAEFKSVLDRLSTFDASLEAVALPPAPLRVGDAVVLSKVRISLPGGRTISEPIDLNLNANENVLLTGRSGAGKSTLFRAIAGVWPYREGAIDIPLEATVMVLPQKPYLPIGTLAASISYPKPEGTYERDAIIAALQTVELPQLVESLDIDDNWTQRLSGGEQQRLALARAILLKPSWLLLDEATAAMDTGLEDRLYERIPTVLPNTTIVTIAHRDTLNKYHDRHVHLRVGDDGLFNLEDSKLIAAQ